MQSNFLFYVLVINLKIIEHLYKLIFVAFFQLIEKIFYFLKVVCCHIHFTRIAPKTAIFKWKCDCVFTILGMLLHMWSYLTWTKYICTFKTYQIFTSVLTIGAGCEDYLLFIVVEEECNLIDALVFFVSTIMAMNYIFTK